MQKQLQAANLSLAQLTAGGTGDTAATQLESVTPEADLHNAVALQQRASELRQTATGAHVLAPCPHDGVCPMDRQQAGRGHTWCHFRQRFERTKLHRMCVSECIIVRSTSLGMPACDALIAGCTLLTGVMLCDGLYSL